jgi:precorrin-3B synthase
MNKVEQWKAEKHGFDVWPSVLEHAERQTPMKAIDDADLERMKWHGVFYRKRDGEGTYMLRLRLTANELTAAQAKEIAYIAYEYGYGIVDVTTRANLQVQGLAIANVPRALARLEAVGVTARQTGHDNIRNVFCHPLSGVDPDELIDTRPLCHDITGLFLGSRVYSDLPRKVNIAMSGAAHHASHYWSQDLSFLAAETVEGQVAFQVLLAGTQGQNPQLAWHLPVLVRPEQVVPVTKAILDLFREQGSRERRDAARLRYLVERIGIGGVLSQLEQRLEFSLEPCVRQPQPPSGYDDLVGWFRQKEQARWAMGLSVPLGRLSWQQLEGLGILAKRWGCGSLRTTPEQGILVLDVPSGFKDAAATAAAALGLSPQADSLARNTVACTGKQFCNIAVTETKGHMFQLIEALRKRAVTLHGIRIHMSGCPSSCAQHHTADIGLKGVRVRRMFGTCEGFDIYLGGGVAGQIHLALPYKMSVDVHQLPLVIEEIIREFYVKHRPGQTFSAYWREELKNREAAKVGEGEYAPPIWLCENCNYRHLGEDPPVFCPSCAGLRRHFARLEEGQPEPAAHQAVSASLPAAEAPRADGFVFACRQEQVVEGLGLAVEVGGKEVALFRIAEKIVAIDNACPHEGGPLAQGKIEAGVVTCPWHGWTFNACTGCSLDPPGRNVEQYDVKLESGQVYVRASACPPRLAGT